MQVSCLNINSTVNPPQNGQQIKRPTVITAAHLSCNPDPSCIQMMLYNMTSYTPKSNLQTGLHFLTSVRTENMLISTSKCIHK